MYSESSTGIVKCQESMNPILIELVFVIRTRNSSFRDPQNNTLRSLKPEKSIKTSKIDWFEHPKNRKTTVKYQLKNTGIEMSNLTKAVFPTEDILKFDNNGQLCFLFHLYYRTYNGPTNYPYNSSRFFLSSCFILQRIT